MNKEIGKVITACRQYHCFTQQYMAYQLNTTVATYANIEHGRVDVSMSKLCRLAKLLYIRPHQILAMAEETYETKEYNWLPSTIRRMTAFSLGA